MSQLCYVVCGSIDFFLWITTFIVSDDQNEIQSKCKTCRNISSYAFCTDCSEFFCEICCKHHIKDNLNHGVNEIALMESNNVCGKCKICKRKSPVRACKKCKTALCSSCNCTNKHSLTEANVAEFRNNTHRSIKKDISETAIAVESLSLAYEIPIPNIKKTIRICGIAILHERIVVVVDRNNMNIMAFKKKKKIHTLKLNAEPRGMTSVYGNKFAVTFPDVKEIRLFFIQDSEIRWEKAFSVSKIGKPFSISHNSDHYAVEIGEEEDGMIYILDSNCEETNRIPNKHGFGYFTGHTIKLCLNKQDSCVYVSAMSKKEISSIDFNGDIKWNIDVPSPRGMLLIPGALVSGMNLILASRRGNTIYQINKGNGSKTILKTDGEISGPRYIAYEPTEKLLCVQLDDCVLRIYNYIPM